jgi:hypothetical protein
VRRAVPPSAEIEARIDQMLSVGVGENPRETLSELIWRVVFQLGCVEFSRARWVVGGCGRLGGWRSGCVRDVRSG